MAPDTPPKPQQKLALLVRSRQGGIDHRYSPKDSVRSALVTLVGDGRDASPRNSNRASKDTLHKTDYDGLLYRGGSAEEATSDSASEQRDGQHKSRTMFGGDSSLTIKMISCYMGVCY